MEKVDITWPVDDSGPASIHVFRLPFGCRAVVTIDSVTLGPAVGGVRMTSDVTADEVTRLARAMTLKNAAAGLPFGGGKSGIHTPLGFPRSRREPVIRAFAQHIGPMTQYIPGPDMGTDEAAMAWITDEGGRALGLPALLGGIPLDDIGATGYGLAECAKALAGEGRVDLAGARVAIQGFGAVGRHVALFLHEEGASVVAVSDRSAAIYDPAGLDVPTIAAAKRLGSTLADTRDIKQISHGELLSLDCDILIPAAQPDVIDDANVDQVRARIILPGANIAVTATAEATLQSRNVLVVPDFLANAGGVICAAVEYRGGDAAKAFGTISERVRANTLEMLDRMRSSGQAPRAAAEAMAWGRLTAASAYRRSYETK